MRQIGTISDLGLAERFSDHLLAEGIKCTVDKDADTFRIWIHDDDCIPTAKTELQRFVADPNHERYRDAARRATTRMKADRDRSIAARARTVNVAQTWNRSAGQSCPMTFGLIAMTCIVAYFTGLDPQHNDPRVDRLWFSNDGTFGPILSGEVWRIFTPIFLHFGKMHFGFNMLSTWQFGMQVEQRKGTAKFLGMVLVIAAVSNAAQFWFQGPWFGGMSGVVYGLFGYIWVKGKLEPESGLGLPQQTATMMLVWHVLCVGGVIANVANWAHGGGLLTGIAMAMSHSIVQLIMRRK